MEVQTLLQGIEVINAPSPDSTQMRNVYAGGRRRQEMPQRAAMIGAEHLPEAWKHASMVLLGPVAGELDDSLAASFGNSIVGAGAQGWLRETGADRRVRPRMPEAWNAEPVLRHARVLFVSDEDLPEGRAQAALGHWSSMVETVAFTRGDRGADVCHRGAWRHIDAFPATPVERTGAGDVFAAAFLIGLQERGDVWEATRFANCAASFVVEGDGVTAVPDRAMIGERLKNHPEIVAQ
jgi:sugar/nucleoside kinase (ribokinase family)